MPYTETKSALELTFGLLARSANKRHFDVFLLLDHERSQRRHTAMPHGLRLRGYRWHCDVPY